MGYGVLIAVLPLHLFPLGLPAGSHHPGGTGGQRTKALSCASPEPKPSLGVTPPFGFRLNLNQFGRKWCHCSLAEDPAREAGGGQSLGWVPVLRDRRSAGQRLPYAESGRGAGRSRTQPCPGGGLQGGPDGRVRRRSERCRRRDFPGPTRVAPPSRRGPGCGQLHSAQCRTKARLSPCQAAPQSFTYQEAHGEIPRLVSSLAPAGGPAHRARSAAASGGEERGRVRLWV